MKSSATQMTKDSLVPIDRPTWWALIKTKLGQATARGMATAEYAVGILAAVALALVLLKVFNAAPFIDTITKLLASIFQKIIGWIP